MQRILSAFLILFLSIFSVQAAEVVSVEELIEAIEREDDQIWNRFGDFHKIHQKLNWLETAGLKPHEKRTPTMTINNLYSLRQAVKQGIGIAVLPDYLAKDDEDLVNILPDADVPNLNTFFVYPEELRNSKRVMVFRDFLLAEARAWHF